MVLTVRLLVGLAVASLIVYAATPYAIALADRLNFYDKPVGYKGHARPIPYLGGAAVMSGFVFAMLLAAADWRKTAPLVCGVTLLWAVGTVDDRRTVSPVIRVVIEAAMAVLIWASGLGWDLHMGSAVDLVLTCLWILAIVNAFNLFDNMDGAAGTMALAVSAGAALIGIVRGDVWLAVGAASLGGACLGFLPRNLSFPARIFLGDGGSMPLGFAAAVLVMVAAGTSTVRWQSLLVALLLVGIPALDTSLVIVSRRRRGVSVLTGGRDHLTHRARTFLPSARSVALCLGGIQALVSVTAVLASQGGGSLLVISVSLYLLAATAAIVLLETQQVEEFGATPQAAPAVGATRGFSAIALGCLVALGLGAGLSPFFFAYYDVAVWVPIGLGLTLACAVGVIARPIRPGLPAGLAVGGLLGLGIWSLGSTAWAESVENAVVSGNRWLAYGALLLLMLVLLRGERRSAVLLGAVGIGVGAVALSVLARLLGGDPGALFLGGRLNAPLGYINGEGCLFVMGFWLCMAAAESRRALLSGPPAALATLMACLALLSQSRGTALAMLCSLIVVVALAPGRTRRIYGLLTVAAGVALAAPDLLRVYSERARGPVTLDVSHAAGRATLLASLGVGVTWAVLTGGWRLVSGAPHSYRVARAGSWLLAVPIALALVVAVGSAHRIERDVRDQWDSFTHLSSPSGTPSSAASQSRLLSGAGNRYDYWRIAWRQWKAHPLLGVGAGNYPRGYYELRATTEDIEQPHSVELQSLAELGLPGGLLFACFVLGAGWGATRMSKRARHKASSRALMVGGLGTLVAWLAQTSVDWMHLLPGLTAIAMAGVAVLVSPRLTAEPVEETVRDGVISSERESHAGGATKARRPRAGGGSPGRIAVVLGASMVLATLVVAGASLSRQGLADFYRARAEGELDTRPAAALTDADRSLAIDSDAVQTYYAKASALARFDQAAGAVRALRTALEHEPDNYVTWTLMGDVAVREGRLSLAKRDYTRAHQLNPQNSTLLKLASSPRAALP
jgi:UDP-GlcNAc:undecaprenyl-phosphate/decaprenyl-phosphate GlcNAc-1-phosphate transferase